MNVLTKPTSITVRKLSPHVGAEVSGIDLNKPVDAETRQLLLDTLHENIVLCVRNQAFDPDQLMAAGKLFGDLAEQDQPEMYGLEGYPLIRKVSSRQVDHTGKIADYNPTWHTDHTHYPRPPKYTILYPVSLPADTLGGGTWFCNTRVAYERLPAEVKAKVDGLRTVNVMGGSKSRNVRASTVHTMKTGGNGSQLMAEHPLVRTHPDHGSKALYFHPKKTENIVGMSPEDSQDFLYGLLEKVLQPDIIYTHQWQPGDLVIWDNRAALHKAGTSFDKSQHRLLYRMCIEGEKPR